MLSAITFAGNMIGEGIFAFAAGCGALWLMQRLPEPEKREQTRDPKRRRRRRRRVEPPAEERLAAMSGTRGRRSRMLGGRPGARTDERH